MYGSNPKNYLSSREYPVAEWHQMLQIIQILNLLQIKYEAAPSWQLSFCLFVTFLYDYQILASYLYMCYVLFPVDRRVSLKCFSEGGGNKFLFSSGW